MSLLLAFRLSPILRSWQLFNKANVGSRQREREKHSIKREMYRETTRDRETERQRDRETER